jgi:hypothetical protein
LKSFHRFALVFLFLIAAAALQGTAADDKPVAFWGVWDFLDGGLLSRSLLFLYWRRNARPLKSGCGQLDGHGSYKLK